MRPFVSPSLRNIRGKHNRPGREFHARTRLHGLIIRTPSGPLRATRALHIRNILWSGQRRRYKPGRRLIRTKPTNSAPGSSSVPHRHRARVPREKLHPGKALHYIRAPRRVLPTTSGLRKAVLRTEKIIEKAGNRPPRYLQNVAV
jgi:hypothetical protein